MGNKKNAVRLTVFIMLLIHLVGYSMITAHAINQLNERAVVNANQLSDRVSNMIENVVVTFDDKLSQNMTNCIEFLPQAQLVTLANPYVRSITLSDLNSIYCSTVTGTKVISLPRNDSAQKELELFYLPHSPLVKSTDVVIIRLFLKATTSYISFGIDTPHFYDLLRTEFEFFHPELVIGNYLFSEQSKPVQFDDNEVAAQALEQVNEVSNPYLHIHYRVAVADYWHYTVKNYAYAFLLLELASILAGLVCYHFASRFEWLTLAISKALRQHHFKPYWQPIFDEQERLAGFEVLARWHHPKKGMIPPDMFIHCAEKSGQIDALFHSLVTETIRAIAPHKASLPDSFHISFNVSAPQLITSGLMADCQLLLGVLAGSNAVLVLELTERVEIPQEPRYLETIAKLKALGIQIALDDFGMGHSSLRYLKNIDIDYLKIDKNFVDMILEGSLEHHILDNVLDLAQRIGVPSVAEGVESECQVAYLMKHNVNYFQGYYFSRPIPAEEFVAKFLVTKKSDADSSLVPLMSDV
jgi:c-di-GMP phosphodiesterase